MDGSKHTAGKYGPVAFIDDNDGATGSSFDARYEIDEPLIKCMVAVNAFR